MVTTKRGSRRSFVAAVGLAAAGALALSACAPPEEAEVPGTENGDTFLQLATGSTGGTYYPLGGEITEIWNTNIDGLTVDIFATGASVQNMRALEGATVDEDAGEIPDAVELVMAVNGTAAQAVQGEGPFAEDPLRTPDNVVALGNIYPEVMQIVVRADSGIESIEDLEGRNVEIGPPGSGTEIAARLILEAHGIDPDDDINAFDSTFGDAATALGDGSVDAAFGILSVPAAGITEVGASHDVNLLSIDDAIAQQLMDDDPSLSTMTIEGGTYPGEDDDVTALTNWATLYTTTAMDEELAYELVRVMYEHAGDITHAVGAQIQLDTAIDGLGPIQLHPGAQRYYEEQGIEVP